MQKSGVSFEQTVTLGRQDLLLYPDVMSRCFSKFGYSLTEPEALEILTECDYYADPLFKRLGADAIDSMDHSSFEGATIVHDLNRPIPDELRRRYSAVIDGGTLEHVFNFPQGIKNCMEMVKVGGHILCISPCNNMMGHGFYQFSPELFFRIFSLQYGFEVEAMYINSGWGKGDWFAVSAPDALRRRVGCVTTDQTNVLVRARRVAEVPIF